MKTKHSIHFIILIFSICLLVYSIFTFWINFHNLDIAHNEILIMEYVKDTYDSNYCIGEQTIYDEVVSLGYVYIESLKGLYVSLILSLFSTALCFYSLGFLIGSWGAK